MGGGTQLLLGAHLTGANMRLCRESGKCRDHISYLSRVPRAPYHGRCPWRKNLPCGEISAHDILLLEEILHMAEWHIEKVLHVRNVNTICKLDK